MVSSSPAQQHHNTKDDAGANTNQRLRKSGVSLVPGPKPLTKHKFYLDVKNHITSGKFETKIKDLGGVLELFLVKEVTHVITDREEWSTGNRGVGSFPRTPRTPHQQHPQQDVSVGEQQRITTPVRGRPKTRADAMLERARNSTPTHQQQAANVKDTLEQTKTWGIPVWSIEKALAWLEKVANGVAAEKQKPRKKCKVVELKAPHVKFEAFDRKHRPVFKEIRNWPCFNLKGAAGSAAVLHKPASEQIMTKSRVLPQRKVNQPVQSGYCEICREEYPNLDLHLVSKKHLAYIRDNDNFLELDSLIHNGTDLDSFLKLNGSKCDGLVVVDGQNNCSLVSHKMPRTRTSSINDCNVNKLKNAPISPTGSESGQRLLRTRKSNMTYIALTAQEQEDGSQVKPEGAREARETRELRSATKTSLSKIADQEPATTWSSGRPKRACIRQKRQNSILDETILANEQRGYYKVEMTPKLRSSAMSATFKDPAIDNVIKKSPIPEQIELTEQFNDDDDKSLIVKFKRMRSSELRQLNNEAENFLFPKKDDSSSEDDIDGDCRDTTVSTHPGESILISSETETENDDDEDDEEVHDEDSCEQSEHSECKKRKRLTQAEAFIEDNKKYYKFETPGSRLRYHGVNLTNNAGSTPKKGRHNGDLDLCDETNREVELTADKYECDNNERVKIDNCKFTLDELRFSFESIPKSEPWYETFSRQDQGAEYYTCFSDSGYWKPFVLPYQMDRIQPLDPKVCIQTYSQIKKLLATEASSGSNSASCSTPDCSAQGSPAPEMDENSKASEDSDNGQPPADNQQKHRSSRLLEQRRRRAKGILLPSRNPRKSPRQHASTLAILSSLIQHRKKRKSNSPNHTLDAIPEASELQDSMVEDSDSPEDAMDKVAESIDDMLSNAFGDFEQVEMSVEDNDEVLEFSCKSDAIEILEDYEIYKHDQRKTGLISAVRRCYSPGKKPGRKKKKNRTGWPKNNAKKNLYSSVLNKTISGNSATPKTKTIPDHGHDQSEHVDDDDNDAVCANVNSKRISVDDDNRVNTSTNSHANASFLDSSVSSVDLDKWENAEKVLSAKITNDANKELCPTAGAVVKLQKATTDVCKTHNNRRLRSSSSPQPQRNRSNGAKRARRMPASPKSPRVLRKPRGRWYRER